MGVIATAVKHLIAAGLTGDALVHAIEEMESQQDHSGSEPVLTKRQARNKRHYDRLKTSEKHLNKTIKTVSDGDANLSSPSGSSPKPLSPNPHQSIPPSPPKGGSSPAVQVEFDRDIWPIYPHKVGKPVALAAFVKARQRASLETVLSGLQVYVAKTDDRPWCNLSTWLNQDRWNDQPAQVARGQPPPREPDLADFFLEKARSEQGYDDGRTIEGSYQRGDFDGPRQAVPRLEAEKW